MTEAVPIPTDLQPIIEEFVNTQEAADFFEEAPFSDHWEDFMERLTPKLPRPLTEDEEQGLYDDLHDWWSNGNFYPQEEATSWSFGDWPWWIQGEADGTD